MQPTRWQIVEILKRRGHATVDELAKELGITLMAVRLHLVVLERDGMVSRNTVRSGPGRPTLVYRLTGQAEDAFPKDYDGLANEVLTAIRLELGSAGVERLCLSAAHRMAVGLRERFAGDGPASRLEAYVQSLAAQGHLAHLEKAESGYFLYSYSCPYFRVAKAHREICVLHRETLRELVGAEVETVSCLLDGDQRCSYLVRVAAPPAQPAAEAAGARAPSHA